MKRISDKEIINDLQEKSERTDYLSSGEYSEIGKYSAKTVRTRFGSWAAGKEEAGLPRRYGECGKLERLSIDDKQRKAQQVKADLGCQRCGYNEFVGSLQFHHVRGEKTKAIGAMISEGYLWETMKEEMRKCVVLCANCHAAATNGKINYP